MSSNTKSRQASAVPTYIKRCNKKDVASSVVKLLGVNFAMSPKWRSSIGRLNQRVFFNNKIKI
jgi:hypothetical protein